MKCTPSEFSIATPPPELLALQSVNVVFVKAVSVRSQYAPPPSLSAVQLVKLESTTAKALSLPDRQPPLLAALPLTKCSPLMFTVEFSMINSMPPELAENDLSDVNTEPVVLAMLTVRPLMVI